MKQQPSTVQMTDCSRFGLLLIAAATKLKFPFDQTLAERRVGLTTALVYTSIFSVLVRIVRRCDLCFLFLLFYVKMSIETSELHLFIFFSSEPPFVLLLIFLVVTQIILSVSPCVLLTRLFLAVVSVAGS